MTDVKPVKEIVKSLPDKKRYAELLTALLSVPIMVTVLIMNISNLSSKQTPTAATQQISPTPSPQPPQRIVIEITPKTIATPSASASPMPTVATTPQPTAVCTQQVGPVDLIAPQEGSTVTTQPISVEVIRNSSQYCAVVWSYHINNDTWSEYTDRAIFIYNLTPGLKHLEVRVKSLGGTDEQVLRRNFTYAPPQTPTPLASPSGQLQ